MRVNGASSALRRGATDHNRKTMGRQTYAAGRAAWRSYANKLAHDWREAERAVLGYQCH
jgi:hypothetical protein